MSTPQALPSQTPTPYPRIASTRLSEEPPLTGLTSVSLPPAATFDILAPLHELLSRLLSSDSPTVNTGTSQQADGSDGANKHSLTVQQLAGEMSTIRTRIVHARRKVAELPDMERTLEQQEQEIRELREKIEKQTNVLKHLAGDSQVHVR